MDIPGEQVQSVWGQSRTQFMKSSGQSRGSPFAALEQRDCCQQSSHTPSVPAFMETDTPQMAYELTAIHGSEPFILCHVQEFNAPVKLGSHSTKQTIFI
jgi:hypothetical protein